MALRNILLGLCILALLSPSPVTAQEKSQRKPNILIIVADDLGYADLGCQGCKDIATPHIDSIAKNGTRFTSGYVIGQQKDVASDNPAVVRELQAAFERWNAELPRAKKKKDGKGGGTP